MLKNYFTTTFRNMRKHTFYTTLNIVGLAIGMAGFLFIALYVLDELSYDRFLPDAERVYRVTTFSRGDQEATHFAPAPFPLAPAMAAEIPEIEATTRVLKWNDFTVRLEGHEDKKFKEDHVYYVEQSFFEVLGYTLLAGNPETALASDALVLTQQTAYRYFGKEAAQPEKLIGRTLLVGGNQASPVTITGIVTDPPVNTHFHFDMLIALPGQEFFNFQMKDWTFAAVHTYVLVDKTAAQAANIQQKIESKLDTFLPKYVLPFAKLTEADYQHLGYAFDFQLQPLQDIHLYSHLEKEFEPNGNIQYVYIFSAVALFILLLACINFMNLSTARGTQRAKEVGVRKVLGAPQQSLVIQFLLESVAYSLVALLIALGLVELMRIPFQHFTGKTLTIGLLDTPWLPIGILLVMLVAGLLAGSYPAFYLSSFQPDYILKKQRLSTARKGLHQYLRSGLVIFQFTVSIALIICTLLIYQQLQYMQNKNLGFNQENVVVIHNDRDMTDQMGSFTDALKNYASILDVSYTTLLPAYGESQMRNLQRESDFQYGIKWFQADENYANTLALDMAAGRWFSKDFASDTAGIILNEAAAHMMGLEDPVGQLIWLNKSTENEQQLKVLGVVKDYHYDSFYENIKPLAIELLRPATSFQRDYIAVRIAPGNVRQSIATIETQWKAFKPNIPMIYSFLDQDFDAMFRAEQQMGVILGSFAALAIFIACLGLFGLAAFTAERRTKEIGIRKVLGASIQSVVSLLSKDFIKLMLVALVIATPIAYVAMKQWLQHFAYKADITYWIFVAAGGMSLLLTLLTVGYQSVKAALANPVDSLRNE